MNKFRKLATNSAVFAIANLGSNLISFIFVRFYTELLTTSEYGTVDLIVTTSSLLIPLLTVAIVEAVFRFGIDESDKKSVITNGIFVVAVGNVLFALIAPFLLGFSSFSQYVFWLSLLILTNSVENVCAQFVRGVGKVKVFAISGIVKTISLVAFNILFLLVFRLHIEGYLLSLILSEVSVLVYLVVATKLWKYLQLKLNKQLLKSMVLYSLPLVPSSLSWWLMNASDKYMILYFVGVSANGLYTVAHKIPTVINLCNTLFMQAWQISAVEESKSEDKNDFYTTVFVTMATVLLLAASSLLIILKPIMRILVAEEYGAVWKLSPFLVLAMVFSAFSSFLGTNYNAMKKTTGALKTTLVGAVFNIVCNYFLIQAYGVNGAAFATMSSFIVMWVYRALDTREFVRIKYPYVRLSVSIAILFIQSFLVISEPQYMYLIQIGCFAVILLMFSKELFAFGRLLLSKIKKTK